MTSEPWLGPVEPGTTEPIGEAFPLSWKNDPIGRRAECSLRLLLPSNSSITSSPGYFTTDVEIFVLSGALKVGDWLLKAHGYTFIPSGVSVGAISAVATALGRKDVEILWMENAPSAARHIPSASHAPAARLADFVPPLDAFYIPWSPSTAPFGGAAKKRLRRAKSGGGCWLLNIVPHYESPHRAAASLAYNAEVACLSGAVDSGEFRLSPGVVGYVPRGAILAACSSVGGGLLFVRADRELDGAVLVNDMPVAEVDWTVSDANVLPGPAAGIIPPAFLKHIGTWEGAYTHIRPDLTVIDRHDCRVELGMHGVYYSQRNTHIWRDGDGNVTKMEILDFPGKFDRDGTVWIESERLAGWAKALDTDGSIIFFATLKAALDNSGGARPEIFDLLRIFNKEETLRYRTWQVKAGDELAKLVHVEERRVCGENAFWLPREAHGNLAAERLEAQRPPGFML